MNWNQIQILIVTLISAGTFGCGGNSEGEDEFPENGSWEIPTHAEDVGLVTDYTYDSDGNAFLIWVEADDSSFGNFNVLIKRFDAETGWEPSQILDSLDTVARDPKIVIDNSGNALAVWWQRIDDTASSDSLFSASYRGESGWSDAQLINPEHFSGADGAKPLRLKIALDGSGNATLAWIGGRAGYIYQKIWWTNYSVNEGWSVPEVVSFDLDISNFPWVEVDIGIDGNGNILLVWGGIVRSDSGESVGEIWANRYIKQNETWERKVLVSRSDSVDDPKIAVDFSGNAIAVWKNSGFVCSDSFLFGTVCGFGSTVVASRYTADDGWTEAAAVLATPQSSPNSKVGSYQVVLDPNGNGFVIASVLTGNAGLDILANRYQVGRGWAEAKIIDQPGGDDSDHPQLVIDKNGNAFAVWLTHDDVTPPPGFSVPPPIRIGIQASRYVKGWGWGSIVDLDINEYRLGIGWHYGYSFPHLSADSSGNAQIVWTQWDKYLTEPVWEIWEARYWAQ